MGSGQELGAQWQYGKLASLAYPGNSPWWRASWSAWRSRGTRSGSPRSPPPAPTSWCGGPGRSCSTTSLEPSLRSIRTDAVGKLRSDAAQLISQAGPGQRALYEDSFQRMVTAFIALHDKGSPPDVAARVIARALAVPRPRARYLTGRNSRRMAIMAAALPTPVLDAVRRRMTHQPAPGSRAAGPQPAEAALAR